MPQKPTMTPLFSQVDVTTGSHPRASLPPGEEQTELLREVLVSQDRTNELLEELVGVLTNQQKQRVAEMNRWRDANPELADRCREAAEALSGVQVEFIDRMTEEIGETQEELTYGDFLLTEFVDRYGPRMAHLNGVIQALAQLGGTPGAAQSQVEED